MTAIFPTLPGMTLDVEKTPNWGTRMQRSVSGRELRVSDYKNAIWQFTLSFDFLRDGNDMRAGPSVGEGVGFNELRTLMGFFNQQLGAAIPFLFFDPSDNTVRGQALPEAVSSVAGFSIVSGGSGYAVGQLVDLNIGSGTGTLRATWQITGVAAGGGTGVVGLALVEKGSYTVVPGTSGLATDGAGTGLTVNVTWATTVQLVRTIGSSTEDVAAASAVSALYFNGVPQAGFTLSAAGDQIILSTPLTGSPAISADFSYYFLVRFTKDAAQFKQFCYQLWELKQIELTSLVLGSRPASGGGFTGGGGGGIVTGGGTGGGGGGNPPPTVMTTITISPSTPTILSTTPLGGVVATIAATNSDGTPFAGRIFFVAPYFDAGGVFAISGNTIIVNPAGPGVSGVVGTVTDFISIDATP